MADLVSLADRRKLPQQPEESVVNLLEHLLERAKTGEVVGIAVATALISGDVQVDRAHRLGHGWQLGGAVLALQHAFARYLVED